MHLKFVSIFFLLSRCIELIKTFIFNENKNFNRENKTTSLHEKKNYLKNFYREKKCKQM